MLNNSPPPPENPAVYEIMWKNVVEPGRRQMTIWRMRVGQAADDNMAHAHCMLDT
jgi:hypothetical protein